MYKVAQIVILNLIRSLFILSKNYGKKQINWYFRFWPWGFERTSRNCKKTAGI